MTIRMSVAAFVLAAASWLLRASPPAPPLPAPPLAEEPCPSSEACLSRSLDRDWNQYYSLIEQASADKKRIAGLLQRAQAANQPDLVAKLKTEQAKIEARWNFAESAARSLCSPRFKDFIVRQREEARKTHAAASERALKETKLYARLVKSTIGPERAGVIADISGYEKEAKELRETFYRDGLMVSLSTIKEASGLLSRNWADLSKLLDRNKFAGANAFAGAAPYVEAINAVVFSAQTGAEAVHAGMSVEEATRKHHNFEALLEASKGAASGTLRMAELLAATPDNPLKRAAMREAFGTAAGRAGIYTNLFAVGLDTSLTVATVQRLKQSEARQLRVETDDAHWRARVDAANRIAHDAAVREERAVRQIEHQRRVEALYRKIQEETK
jgi:hypothetical protein